MNTQTKKCREYYKYLLCPETESDMLADTVSHHAERSPRGPLGTGRGVRKKEKVTLLYSVFTLHATARCSLPYWCIRATSTAPRKTPSTQTEIQNKQEQRDVTFIRGILHPFWNGGDGVLSISKTWSGIIKRDPAVMSRHEGGTV